MSKRTGKPAPKPKRGRGRPAHEPTDAMRRQVESMAGFGLTHDDIAVVMAISAPTLRLHYAHELEVGGLKATVAVANNLYRLATKDDPKAFQAAAFWLRCRAGWSEYAPPPEPRAPAAEKLGKKEIRDREAATAAKDTSWSRLVH